MSQQAPGIIQFCTPEERHLLIKRTPLPCMEVATADLKCSFVNAALLNLLGGKAEDFLQDNWLNGFEAKDRKMLEDFLKTAESSTPEPTSAQNLVLKIKAKNQQQPYSICIFKEKVLCSTAEVNNVQQSFFWLTLLDITQIKEKEEFLEKLKKGFDQAALVEILNKDQKVIFVNDAMAQVYDKEAAELLQQPFVSLLSPLQSKEFYLDLWDTLEKGFVWQGDLCQLNARGDEFWVKATIIPVQNSGQTEYIAIKHEITQQRKQNRLVEAINEIQNTAVVFHNNSTQLLQGLIRKMLQFAAADWAFIIRIKKSASDTPTLVCEFAKSPHKTLKSFDRINDRVLQDLAAWTLQEGKPTFLHAESGEEKIAAELKTEFAIDSMMIVPLYSGDEMIGLCGLVNPLEKVSEASYLSSVQLYESLAQILSNLGAREFESNLFVEIKKNQRHLESIVNSLNDLVFEVDQNRVLLNVWTSDERLIEKPKSEVLGKKLEEVYGWSMAAPFVDAIEQAFLSKKVQNFEFQNKSKKNWFHCRITPIRTKTNEKKRCTMVISDISNEVENRNNLKVYNNRLNLVLSNNRIGVWDFDEKNKTFFADPMLYSLLEFKGGAENFLSSLSALIGQLNFNKIYRAYLKAKKTLQSFECQLEINLNEEKKRFLFIKGSFEENRLGQLEKAYGMCFDITESEERKKILEEQSMKMIQSSKMATVGEMAAGIAHEVNNPLAIIQGSLSLLKMQKEMGQLNLEQLDKSFLKIEQMVVRISKIIKGLKAFSRDGEEDPFERTSFKLILDDTLSLCQSRLKKHQVDLVVEDFNDFHFDCRSVQISQVILNLIHNGSDAIEHLKEKWVRIGLHRGEEFFEVIVTDSGPGIPPEIAQKILQPFFTTKEVGKGTGLGLSISLGIARAHGGELSYNSSSPNTQFVLRLPYRQVSSGAGSGSGSGSAESSRSRGVQQAEEGAKKVAS